MPRQVFTAGEILTAANMNDLADSTVMVFDTSAARGSAIPSPSEGMVTYLKDTDSVDKYDGSAFVPVGIAPAILQVVSTTITNTFTTTGLTYVEITGLTVSITPSSASSEILVTGSINMSAQAGAFFRLMRNSTPIALGDAAGSRTQSYSGGDFLDAGQVSSAVNFLDSPSTTSATTYSLQLASNVSGQTAAVNRAQNDPDLSVRARGVSTITVMEVAG